MNYDLEMIKMMKDIKEGEKLLLHACCGPCSTTVLERLSNFFDITIYYYNPNIKDYFEFKKRLDEVKKLIDNIDSKYKIKLIEGNYNIDIYNNSIKGYEDLGEGSIRCYKCYQFRLDETARVADELGFKYFTTTLSISPYKNSKWINEIGNKLDKKYNTNYLYSDFKKNNGYKRSIELSSLYDLYRQDYCGCIYSYNDYLKRINDI